MIRSVLAVLLLAASAHAERAGDAQRTVHKFNAPDVEAFNPRGGDARR